MLLDHDPQRDESAIRTYPYKKNAFLAERSNPYGFWSLKMQRGQLPAALSGQYTSIWHLERAIEAYKDEEKEESTE